MVFESRKVILPELPGTEMSVIELVGKVEMNPFDIVG